jgi:hypothetical protein
MDTPRSVTRAETVTLEDVIHDVIRAHGGLVPGEVVTHFDLVASTRRIDPGGQERIERRHWSTPGSDPHLSQSYLNAQAVQLLSQIVRR